MNPFLNKKLVIAATTVAMLGGTAAALAATQSSSGSGAQAYVNDLAGRLGVTPAALSTAIKAADSDQINAAVAAGRLTQAQATRLAQRIAQSASAMTRRRCASWRTRPWAWRRVSSSNGWAWRAIG